MLASAEAADLLVVGETGLSAGPVPPLSGADVVLVADEELLEETALSVSEGRSRYCCSRRTRARRPGYATCL